MVEKFRFFVGIDWATEEHQVAVLDASGALLHERKVQHDGEALEAFARWIDELADGQSSTVAVAIETPHGAVLETLLERGVVVFAINPKQLDRFRDRHTVAGAKDDRRDAYVLGDSLRTDMKLFRQVVMEDAVVVELREMSRTHDELVAQVGALANRFREHVHRYFPQWLELGSFLDDAWLRDLYETAPTPAQLRHLKRSKVQSVLERARVRRVDADTVLSTLRKRPLTVAPGVTHAASTHALMALRQLRFTLELKKECDARLRELLRELSQPSSADAVDSSGEPSADEPPRRMHRDAEILLSLPGAGVIVSATMLAEASSALAARDYHGLRLRSGVAPVSHQTGKQKHPTVSMRRACNPRLRNTLHPWATSAIQKDDRCRSHYKSLRMKGHAHARALRGVADRLLAMLVSMLRSGTVYDPLRRTIPVRPAPDAAA